MTPATEAFCGSVTRWLPMKGTRTSDPEQAVDHRGHAGQEADHRLQDVAHPLRRELDDEDGDEEGARRGR